MSSWRGIPASPNWFFSGAAAYQQQSGILAYGAANKLVLLAVTEEAKAGGIATAAAGTVPSVVGTLSGHNVKDRVSGVAFSPHAGAAQVCATCGTDGIVQVWDLDAKLSLKQHSRHDRKSVAAVVCSALATRPTVVYSGDVKGLVVGWDYLSGSVSTAAPYKESVISLASAQASTEGSGAVLVAVGYKGGGIAVLDFSSGAAVAVLHRLKGHAQDVQCLSWRPTYNIEAEEVEEDEEQPQQQQQQQPMMLCSSGKDRTIKLWTISSDAGMETRSWPLPAGRNKRSGGRDSRERVWLTHAWAGADSLVSTSHGGDLLRWNLGNSDGDVGDSDGNGGSSNMAVTATVTPAAGGAPEWTAFPHLGHAHAVFSCVIIPPASSASLSFTAAAAAAGAGAAGGAGGAVGAAAAAGNEEEEGYQVITISSNRQIVQWDCTEGTAKWTLPTIGGHVYALAASRVDPGAVAIGCGDNLIRVWQMGVTTSFECQTLWKGVQSRVHALSWHPILEGILAFGLEDGSVGVYDVNKGRHTLAHTTHLRAVTALCWLPATAGAGGDGDYHQEDDDCAGGASAGGSSICSLYSCGGDGCIYEHGDPRKAGAATSEARDVTACIRDYLSGDGRASAFEPSTISWYFHNDSSTIASCSSHRRRSSSSSSSHIWGKEDAGDGTPPPTRAIQTLLAVGCVDGAIIVCNTQLEVLVTLRGQRKGISSLDWTFVKPSTVAVGGGQTVLNEDGIPGTLLLASGSDDSTVRVTSVGAVLASDAALDALIPCDVAFRHYKLPARVTSVAWSSHSDSLLVAGLFDGTAQVWDVEKDSHLANFRGHTAKVLAVLWSPLQPHLVLSGSVDQQVCLWGWKEQPFTLPLQQPKRATKSTKKQLGNNNSNSSASSGRGGGGGGGSGSGRGGGSNTTETVMAARASGAGSAGNGSRKNKGVGQQAYEETVDRKASSLSEVGTAAPAASSAAALASSGKRGQQRDSYRADKRSKALLPNCSIKQQKVEVTQLACCKLAAKMYQHEGSTDGGIGGIEVENTDAASAATTTTPAAAAVATSAAAAAAAQNSVRLGSLGLFGSRNDAVQTIAAAASLHTADKRTEASFMMQVWQGTGVELLEKAVSDCTLTDAMVAMSPMAGQAVWSKVAHAYAKQLSKSGDHHLAAGYYLATHNVQKAIDAYCAAGMFEEAVAVAKIRLSRHDPKVSTLYKAWAKKCEGAGHFEQAAKCYLAVQNATAAVQVLSQRGGKRGLLTAYSVATSAGIASTGLAVRVVQECRRDLDFETARTIVQTHSELSSIEHLLVVEQEFIRLPSYRGNEGGKQKDVGAWGDLYFPRCESPEGSRGGKIFAASLVAAIADAWQGMDVTGVPRAAAAAATHTDDLMYSDAVMQDCIVLSIRNGIRALVYTHDATAAASYWLDAMIVARDLNDLQLSLAIVQQLLVDGAKTVEWMLRSRENEAAVMADNQNLRKALCSHVAFGVILQTQFRSNYDASPVDLSFRSKTTRLGAQLRSVATAVAGLSDSNVEAGSAAGTGRAAEDRTFDVTFVQLVKAKDALIQGCPALPLSEREKIIDDSNGNDNVGCGSGGDDTATAEKWKIGRGPEPRVAAYYLRHALRTYLRSDDTTIAQSAKAEMDCVLQWALTHQHISPTQLDVFAAQL